MMEITPNTLCKPDNFADRKSVKKIIGKSVISGASAILMPDFMPFCNDSETRSTKRGPGEKPADIPKIMPMTIKFSNCAFALYYPTLKTIKRVPIARRSVLDPWIYYSKKIYLN